MYICIYMYVYIYMQSHQSQPVDWDEINAAWGQTALLVQTLASHWDFTFPSYRLVLTCVCVCFVRCCTPYIHIQGT